MELPIFGLLVGIATAVMAGVIVFQRPPLTTWGRVFYVVYGLTGVIAGTVWILILGFMWWGRLPTLGFIARYLVEKHPVGTFLSLLAVVSGLASLLWAMTGPSPPGNDGTRSE